MWEPNQWFTIVQATAFINHWYWDFNSINRILGAFWTVQIINVVMFYHKWVVAIWNNEFCILCNTAWPLLYMRVIVHPVVSLNWNNIEFKFGENTLETNSLQFDQYESLFEALHSSPCSVGRSMYWSNIIINRHICQFHANSNWCKLNVGTK